MDNIVKIELFNTGGNCLVDIVTLHNGRIMVISEDYACVYNDMQAFHDSSEGNLAGFVGSIQY